MAFFNTDPKVSWCEDCGALWDKDDESCTNPGCAKGKKLGVEVEEDLGLENDSFYSEDGILDDPDAPFIINTILNLVTCKSCKSEWDLANNFCSNDQCRNSQTFASAVKTHEPDPTETMNSRPVTTILMAILNQSGYAGLSNALKQRAKEGVLKYGTMLKTHNGRNMELDALQESLDLNQYLFGCIMERDSEIEKLKQEMKYLKDREKEDKQSAYERNKLD